MVYKRAYTKLCKDFFVNIVCDGQPLCLVWDFDGELKRAPLVVIPKFFKTVADALNYLKNNPDIGLGYQGFIDFESNYLARCKSASMIETYEIEALEHHSSVCPLCGRKLEQS